MTVLYHDSPELTTKICTKCLTKKPLSNFYRESKRKDGHKSICKICCDAQENGHIIIQNLVQLPLLFETKVCADCQKDKPLGEFGKGQRRCKQCQNARYRASDIGLQRAIERQKWHPSKKENKICRRCLTEKSLSDFAVSSKSTDKHAAQCKECVSHRQYVVNRERSLARMRNHYLNNKSAYQSAMRKWREENKDRDREVHRQWAEENPLKINEYSKRRKARVRGVTVEPVSYERILERDGLWCFICEKEILPHQKLHFDHFVPINRNGAHIESNIHPSHDVCNLRKHDKLLSDLTSFDRRGPDK